MESTVTQDLEGHSVFLTEDDIKTEYNPEPASDPLFIKKEPEEPTLPEFAFVKVEPNTEDPLYIDSYTDVENLQESGAIKQEPTSPPGTPTHSTTLDNITSQLDQVTRESPKTQLQFDLEQEVYVKRELEVNQCTVCNKVLSSKHCLRVHLLSHSDQRKHVCDECGKCFTSYGYLKQHQKIYNPPGNVCSYCNVTFTCKAGLNQHIEHRHMKCDSGGNNFSCSECNESFSFYRALTKHQRTHIVPHYNCKMCKFECDDLTVLRTHVTEAHEGDKKFRCKTCGKLFLTLIHLKTHEKVHTHSFRCPHCSSRHLTNTRLKLHMKNQHSDVQLTCDVCSRSFSGAKTLKQHKLQHTRPEKCGICNKEFSYKQDLRRHISKHHATDKK